MGTCASRTVGAPVSHQKARISFDLHGCVTWMSTPCTALEPLDRSSQPARSVVLNDPRLQLDRVEHRSLAGCSMHNLGSGQRVAARARWRGRASRRTSAIGVCCSNSCYAAPRIGLGRPRKGGRAAEIGVYSSSHGPRTDSKDATGSIPCATTPASAIAPSLARR